MREGGSVFLSSASKCGEFYSESNVRKNVESVRQRRGAVLHRRDYRCVRRASGVPRRPTRYPVHDHRTSTPPHPAPRLSADPRPSPKVLNKHYHPIPDPFHTL